MFGFLNVYKPKGMTSHDVVAIMRRITKIKQIGHTGTLDPFAEGVLPICIGKSTRLIEYLNDDKAYIGTIKFGNSTTTYDIEGEVLKKSDHFLKVALGYCNSFIYEPKTGYFKECGYSKHQDEIIAWLDICFPKGWELEEERNIVNFVKNSLVIKGNFFDKDKLIEDSVRFAPYIPRRKQWFD